MFRCRTLLFAALCSAATSLAAQELTPPKLLQIYFESVKPGKGEAHERHETGWPIAFANAKLQNYYFALTPMTGNNDVIYMSGYPSYADFEKTNEAVGKAPGLSAKLAALADKDGEFLNNSRGIIAAHRPDGSIGRMEGADYSKVRGWRITSTRVRIGQTDEFMEYRKMLKDAYARAGINSPRGLYQITQGVNTPTYLVFRAYTSLSEFDADSAMNAAVRAVQTADDIAKMEKLYEGAVLTSETNVYAVSPKQSYMPATYAADPFWKSNPVFAAAAQKSAVTQAGAAKAEKKNP